ncbi:MAG: methylenetetrahydrofolate reductase C-terminal domain-containing protein [Candidatus Limnocylindrales bacterium]
MPTAPEPRACLRDALASPDRSAVIAELVPWRGSATDPSGQRGRQLAYLCPESQCVKNQRNGPCGGSTDGVCEVPGRPCIWARAYQRLAPYGEIGELMARPPVIWGNALRRTSSWSNTCLGRDHATRPPVGPGAAS